MRKKQKADGREKGEEERGRQSSAGTRLNEGQDRWPIDIGYNKKRKREERTCSLIRIMCYCGLFHSLYFDGM